MANPPPLPVLQGPRTGTAQTNRLIVVVDVSID